MNKRFSTVSCGACLMTLLWCAVSARSADTDPATQPAAPVAGSISIEEIRELRMSSQTVPPIIARHAAGKASVGVKLPLEGAMVMGRVAELATAPESEELMVRFLPAATLPDELPRYVQLCGLLEKMESLAKDDQTVRFRLWGRSSNYKGKSYLMPERVTLIHMPASAPSNVVTTRSSTSKPDDDGAGSHGASLLDQLMRDKREPSVTAGAGIESPITNHKSVAPGAGGTAAAVREKILVDRLVRVMRESDDKWWNARFESDNALGEPPIELLPGALLEVAEAYGGRPLRISGRITSYKGKRYLLLWKVLSESKLGRF